MEGPGYCGMRYISHNHLFRYDDAMLSAPKVLSLLNPPSVKVRVLEQTQQASVLAEVYAVLIFFVHIKVSSHPVAHEFIVCYTAHHHIPPISSCNPSILVRAHY